MKGKIYKILMSICFLSVIMLSVPAGLMAQEEKEEKEASPLSFQYGADLVSRYVWRGMQFGEGAHIQPYGNIVFGSGSHSLSFGVWGSYDLGGKIDSANTYSEFDLSLRYSFATETIGTFTVGAADYYYPYLKIPYSNFEKDGLGGHTVELSAAYQGPESLPVSFLVSSNFLNDLPEEKSFYFEGGYTVDLNSVPISFFAGFAQGVSTWHQVYSDKLELINLGVSASRSFEITENYSITATVALVRNTCLREYHPTIKLSF